MIEPPVHAGKDRIPRWLTLTVVLTLLTLGWLGWTALSAYRFVTGRLPVIIRMEEVRGQILLFDEVLTMSARMATATGDPQWEARYRRFDPQLGEALEEVKRLAPVVAQSRAAAQTDAANTKLVAMDNRAFELVRQRQQAGALQLLSSEEYEAQKKVYAAGMAELNRLLTQAIDSVRAERQFQVLSSAVIATISAPLLMLGWWFGLQAARRWQTTLVESNRQLNRKTAELEESSHQLDRKVSERTKQLKESELATLNMMEDAVRNGEKVERAYEDLKREVAGRKKAETHLLQAQKMEAVGQLAGGIAHDFNNILGCIMGYTELAGMEISNQEAVKENLQEVLQASHRARELVLQILTFSRQQEQERNPIRLQLVIKEALKFLRASLPSTIEICADIAADAPTVLAGATQIHQIIMNLATNAAHAMGGRPGQLGIKLHVMDIDADFAGTHPDLRVGRFVSLAISDTGCGMDPATLQRIFEPFFTTKAPGEGTGLGLAVVHGIVKSHEGAMTVYSELGKGTVFHLYFPVHEGAATETVVEAGAIAHGAGERVLFVDDEVALASLGKKFLERSGYHVTTKTSSLEALAAFRAGPDAYDLVITDLTMPNMTGADLAGKLLNLRPDLPIILTTGFGGSMNSAKAQALGIRELLMKPLTAQVLAEAVHRVFIERKGKQA